MILIRPAAARGHADHGWLQTWHSFSFDSYYDPAEMNWGCLRVLNEDKVASGGGFGMHPHRNMEIVTYLLAGALRHRDTMGNGTVIRRPEVQRMSAGRGVMHSETNAAEGEAVHLLQIWIEPTVRDIAPEYEQKAFPDAAKRGRLLPIATPDGRAGSLSIHQNANLYATLLAEGETVAHALAPGRRAYVHVARGNVRLNDTPLAGGDGAKVADETALTLTAAGEAEVLLFDLP